WIRGQMDVGWTLRERKLHQQALEHLHLALDALSELKNASTTLNAELMWAIAVAHSQQQQFTESLQFADQALQALRHSSAAGPDSQPPKPTDFVQLPITAQIARY